MFYDNLDSVAFKFYNFNIHWYGIIYVLGFLFSYIYLKFIYTKFGFEKEESDKLDLFFLLFLIFSVLFGRLFYVLFYNPFYYMNHLSEIIRLDHGGMSIHGGFFGAFLVIYWFSKKYNKSFFKLSDMIVIPTGFWLAIGRIGNYINQELVGKITTNHFFGTYFPKVDNNLRWPSQLFESAKNFTVFFINIIQFKFLEFDKKPGLLTAWFLFLYNFGRFFVDFFRVPTSKGILFLSLGQTFCLIYGLVGFALLIYLELKVYRSY